MWGTTLVQRVATLGLHLNVEQRLGDMRCTSSRLEIFTLVCEAKLDVDRTSSAVMAGHINTHIVKYS